MSRRGYYRVILENKYNRETHYRSVLKTELDSFIKEYRENFTLHIRFVECDTRQWMQTFRRLSMLNITKGSKVTVVRSNNDWYMGWLAFDYNDYCMVRPMIPTPEKNIESPQLIREDCADILPGWKIILPSDLERKE